MGEVLDVRPIPDGGRVLDLEVDFKLNDTIVLFDRVRENMRRFRRKPLIDVMNMSLNQTLSRTFITSGTTLMVVLSLYFFGGDVINTFAFVLLVGVLVGTYSSIFVAATNPYIDGGLCSLSMAAEIASAGVLPPQITNWKAG